MLPQALLLAHKDDIERALCEKSLYAFLRHAWSSMDPAEFTDGWHLKVICDELEKVARGEERDSVVCVPPRHSKPVDVNAWVVERTRGRIRLGSVSVGDEVLTHKGRFRQVTAVHEQGALPVVEVRTSKGRSVLAAPDHPFLTVRGWVPAGDLAPGDVVGAVRSEECGTDTITEEEARLLGYFVGDGCTKYKQMTITNIDRGVIDDVHRCARAVGFYSSEHKKVGTDAIKIVIKSDENPGKWRGPNKLKPPLWRWLEKHGLFGKCSYTKRVPPAVMSGSRNIIGHFLGAYWACDGSVKERKNRQSSSQRITAQTVGKDLATDVQHLFLRLGMSAGVYEHKLNIVTKRQGDNGYISYRICVDSVDSWKFSTLIPTSHAAKSDAALTISPAVFDKPLAEDEVIGVAPAGVAVCRCLTVDEDHSFTANDIAVHNSLIISVAFPAWIWTWWPSCQFIATSYAAPLSIRDSVKMRRLVESPWYQKHWGNKVALVHDQNQKQYFQTTAGGHRFSTSVGGLLTGYGADIFLCDDPHNVVDSESENTRTATVTWWREAVPTRLNDPKTGRKLVIQQRVHEKDVAGWCIKEGYSHLVLPAEFEHNHPHRSPLDPRKEDGELLWPARFGRPEIDKLKRSLGSYAVAGQFQQRPAPRDGGMFKRTWFPIVSAAPARARRVRYWDLAATSSAQSDDPDWTVGLKMARDDAGVFYIEDVRRLRETSWKVEQAIQNTASADGKSVPIGTAQDPGAAGKAQAAYLVRQLAGYVVKAEPETGSKETRAAPLAAQAEAGNVVLVKAGWNDDFIDELCSFPNAAHDDQVDAAAGAFRRLLDSGTTGLLDYYAKMATQQYLEERIKRLTPIERAALLYVENAGGNVLVAQFDDDHDPIGARVRGDLLRDGWIHENDGLVSLADGVAAALTRKD